MYGRTGTRVRQAVSSSQFPYSPACQSSRREIPRRAGWIGERTAGLLWACTGARAHGRTGVQVHGCTGVRARRTVSSSHFPTRRLTVRPPRNASGLGGRLREGTGLLGICTVLIQRRFFVYPFIPFTRIFRLSVYPLPLYSFLNSSVYSQTRCEIPFYRHRGRSNARFPLSGFPFPFSLSGALRILFSKCPRPECRGHFATLYIQICSKNRRTVSRVGRAFMAPAVVTVSAPTALA